MHALSGSLGSCCSRSDLFIFLSESSTDFCIATFKDQLKVQAVTDAGYFCQISFRIAASVALLIVPPNFLEFAVSITP